MEQTYTNLVRTDINNIHARQLATPYKAMRSVCICMRLSRRGLMRGAGCDRSYLLMASCCATLPASAGSVNACSLPDCALGEKIISTLQSSQGRQRTYIEDRRIRLALALLVSCHHQRTPHLDRIRRNVIRNLHTLTTLKPHSLFHSSNSSSRCSFNFFIRFP